MYNISESIVQLYTNTMIHVHGLELLFKSLRLEALVKFIKLSVMESVYNW